MDQIQIEAKAYSTAHALYGCFTLADLDDGRSCGKFGIRAVLSPTGTDGISATL